MPCSPEESDDLTVKFHGMSWDSNEIFNENYGIFMGISWDINEILNQLWYIHGDFMGYHP